MGAARGQRSAEFGLRPHYLEIGKQIVKKLRGSHSVEMLKAVVDGQTYEQVAKRYMVSRTAVERRIKLAARQIAESVGIAGLSQGHVSYVTSLRKHKESILVALAQFDPSKSHRRHQDVPLISEEDFARGLKRMAARSTCRWRDQALFQFLFVTGARPLEVARLEVRDYLEADGTVRRLSEFRTQVAIGGRPRPLHFVNAVLDGFLSNYLAERLVKSHGVGGSNAYRGLDPNSRLFLSHEGEGFRIFEYGAEGHRRYLCRPILELYRKLFAHSRLQGVTSLAIRHTVAARLYAEGMEEEQIAELMGLSDKGALREQFPRLRSSAMGQPAKR